MKTELERFQLPTPLYLSQKNFHKHGKKLHSTVCGTDGKEDPQNKMGLQVYIH